MIPDPGSDVACRLVVTVWHDGMYNTKHMRFQNRGCRDITGCWCFWSELIVSAAHSETFHCCHSFETLHLVWDPMWGCSPQSQKLWCKPQSLSDDCEQESLITCSQCADLLWGSDNTGLFIDFWERDILILFFQLCFGS